MHSYYSELIAAKSIPLVLVLSVSNVCVHISRLYVTDPHDSYCHSNGSNYLYSTEYHDLFHEFIYRCSLYSEIGSLALICNFMHYLSTYF